MSAAAPTRRRSPRTAVQDREPQVGKATPVDELQPDVDHVDRGAGGSDPPAPPPARGRGYGGGDRLPRWQLSLIAFGILLLAIAIAGIANDMLRELGREDPR